MTAQLYNVDEVVEMMRRDMRNLVERLRSEPNGLPSGHYDGHDFVCLDPFRSDKHAGSFRIAVSGPVRGLTKDFASGQTWTPLNLVAALLFGGDKRQAWRWSLAWLGLDGTDPAALRQTRRVQAEAREEDDAAAAASRAEKSRRAKALWLKGVPIAGTPAETYLRGRGIDFRALGHVPGALRFLPELKNKESARAWPAMVAAIVDEKGATVAVHRTWLEIGPGGRVRKAPLLEAKMAWGPMVGGAIRLWNGTFVDPKTGEIKRGRPIAGAGPGQMVDVTEGIEDGLSVAVCCQDVRVWAAISVSNMGGLKPHPNVSAFRLWKQNDPPGSGGDRGFARAVDRLTQRGIQVLVTAPPAGFKDVNDVLVASMRKEGVA